jgi:hypothetical protein
LRGALPALWTAVAAGCTLAGSAMLLMASFMRGIAARIGRASG